MKVIIAAFLFLTQIESFSQQIGWVYIGQEIGYDFYYKENTIVRGQNTFVVVVGVPQREMKDNTNTVIKYITVNLRFYRVTYGTRCIISDHIYFYEDNTYKKANFPKRDIPISDFSLLPKLYEKIR